MLNSTLIGLKSYNILKCTENLVTLLDCHDQSLTPCQDICCIQNSLTPCHELYRSSLARSYNLSISIAIVNVITNILNFMSSTSRMYARSQAVKRPRSSSSRTSSTHRSSASSSRNQAGMEEEKRENHFRDRLPYVLRFNLEKLPPSLVIH